MTKEGMERGIQMPRMIMKFERILHCKVTLHILSWARNRYVAMPGITPSDPNNLRPGWYLTVGFESDAPE